MAKTGYSSNEEEAFVSAYEQEWTEEDEESMFLGMYPAFTADEEAKRTNIPDFVNKMYPSADFDTAFMQFDTQKIAMAACKESTDKIMTEQEFTSSYSAAVEWAAEINADYIADTAVPLCMQVTNKTEHKMLNDHIRSGHVSDLPNGMSCDSCTKGKRMNSSASKGPSVFIFNQHPEVMARIDAMMLNDIADMHELSSDTDQ